MARDSERERLPFLARTSMSRIRISLRLVVAAVVVAATSAVATTISLNRRVKGRLKVVAEPLAELEEHAVAAAAGELAREAGCYHVAIIRSLRLVL